MAGQDESALSAQDDVVLPEHDVEKGQDYSALVPAPDASAEPIRKISTIDRGDSFYAILMQNGVSARQAYDILNETKPVFDLSKIVPGRELVLIFSPDNQDLIGVEYSISDISRLDVSINGESIDARKQEISRVLPSGYSGRIKQTDYIVEKGDNLYTVLRSNGVCDYQIGLVIKSVKKVYNLSGIIPGNAMSIWVTEEEPARLARLTYEIDYLNLLEVVPENGAYKATKQTFDVDVRHERAEGTINSSLYESAIQAGLSPEVVMALSDIFAWDINFFTDIRQGDHYTVIYERYYVKDTFRGYGRVVAARFVNQGSPHVAVYFDDGDGVKGYYDEEGKPIRKLFLKAPLNYRRISSGFSRSRIHPIYQVARPHLGVDYAAPSGTPVVALGNGTVTFKGTSGGFGKSIQITHQAGYVTYYGHLSGYAKGISKGTRVSQGEVIGYVGSTGASTGPHLDFRVRHNGKFINPLKLKPVNGPPLKGKSLARYKEFSTKRLAMLDDPSLNHTAKMDIEDVSL
ncbi:MAG TPA: M23 family metallopeptidase [Deltaproteobacteria bacterium]|nr:M23 family metallopeptidase [Deltaproteobacteria bacterium]HPX48923.1 M23 family metallopeptidase [Deltaproteobacteria bacterium]HRC98461.1 M23 family metallopeptidase [Deltaproteobacteria bacterium]HRT45006.1 M23 family metallopeptidase [Desulfomonilia bacterium]